MISSGKEIILGMSGGVDSSLSACILAERGYRAIGITLSLWEDGSRRSSTGDTRDVKDARRVCRKLNMPHYTISHTARFGNEVVDYFIAEYANGRTPNPCVVCNERVKFRTLLSKAIELGVYYIATGHYARVEYDRDTGFHLLKRGVDHSKDQSYFLARLPQKVLRRVLLPMGTMGKDETRRAAESRSLHVSGKEESQEVCFLQQGEQSPFLKQRIGRREGQIVTEEGEILGTHSGIYNYTIGQRKGLGLSRGYPLYVTGLDPETAKVIVGREDSLLKRRVLVERLLLLMPRLGPRVEVEAKIRYGSPLSKAVLIHRGGDEAEVVFDTPQRAVTPGQLLVAYVKESVYGSGWIRSSL
jgi:tRNA-specific 2-thiouridylase